MNFIDKLIDDTKNGALDEVWHYSDINKYKFVKKKHPLNGLNFAKASGQIIFPNGFGLNIDIPKQDELINAINTSITKSAYQIMKDYSSGSLDTINDDTQLETNQQDEDNPNTDDSNESIEEE